MRRLFTPVLCCLSLLAMPLAGCDSAEPESALSGEWTLAQVTDVSGAAVEGPVSSKLVFGADGTFSIDSTNDCTGTYTSQFAVNQQVLDFPTASCTEAAGTLETDLVLVLGVYRDGVLREPALFAAEPTRLQIRVSAPGASRVLTFTRE